MDKKLLGIPIRVLIVEDSDHDASLLVQELKRGGYDPMFERVDSEAAMNKALLDQAWEIVICDYRMPKISASDAMALLRKSGRDLPLIIVSGSIGEDLAVAAMREGAQDYITKSNLARLVPAIERELDEARSRRDHKQSEELVKYLAYCDPMTGLPNRTLLQDRLKQAISIAAHKKHPMAFLLMDLDRFKEINDTLGHPRGDLLLQQVGARLKSVLWEPDTVSRLGGDEFAVLLPRLAAPEDINVVIQKIQNVLKAPFMIEGLPIAVDASMGIALYPDHGTDVETLIQRADVAMYVAKRTGSGYAFYSSEQNHHSPHRLALMGGLREAVEFDQLRLHYQPIISLKTGRVMDVEALVRWQHPQHGMVPPGQFIPLAEQTGLIKPITLWVLSAALNQCRAWQQAGMTIPVSVNLSARNLHDPELPDQVRRLLETSGLPADRLKLEITESAIMTDSARALETLMRLSGMGVRLSLDDFGTGYSSLGYLKKLPVDEIKIDRSFVTDMTRDENDEMIVRSTIDLGHNLGRKVVAEGVEKKETWDRLAALGCDAAQGYYMSRPVPPSELSRWAGESPWGLKQT
jgi:diguanylate cyclase (GGDEF)-like protein